MNAITRRMTSEITFEGILYSSSINDKIDPIESIVQLNQCANYNLENEKVAFPKRDPRDPDVYYTTDEEKQENVKRRFHTVNAVITKGVKYNSNLYLNEGDFVEVYFLSRDGDFTKSLAFSVKKRKLNGDIEMLIPCGFYSIDREIWLSTLALEGTMVYWFYDKFKNRKSNISVNFITKQ